MNLKNLVHLLFVTPLLALLVILSGCIKTYNIVPTESPQGTPTGANYTASELVKRNVRVYNEWMTHAAFDVMPWFDNVRREYAEIYCNKLGKDKDFFNSFLRRQLEENKYWLIVHVLADVRSDSHKILSDKDAEWSFYIEKLDGTRILPQNVEMVELSPEVLAMWGPTYNNFKTPYIVKFPAKDLIVKKQNETPQDEKSNSQNNNIILDHNTPFRLVVSSVNRKCYLYWGDHPDLHKAKKREQWTRVIVEKKAPPKEIKQYDNYYWLRSPGL